MTTFVSDFIKAVQKRKEKKVIDCVCQLQHNCNIHYLPNDLVVDIAYIPQSVKLFYSEIEFVNIFSPRNFELLPLSKFFIVDNQYLVFAKIDNIHLIAFDMSNINAVDNEYDIVSLDDKYLITKTFSSFITNKIWAWIDRRRTIWKEELFL